MLPQCIGWFSPWGATHWGGPPLGMQDYAVAALGSATPRAVPLASHPFTHASINAIASIPEAKVVGVLVASHRGT